MPHCPIGGVVLLLALLGVAVGYVLIYRIVLRPVNSLITNMSLAEQGRFYQLDDVPRQGEMALLVRRYNRMTSRLKHLINEVYAQQLLRKQAQLASLESQMDEHFLYNTLNTVYLKALEQGADETARMLVLLSRYFRLSLAKGHDKAPLGDVVQLIEDYLAIQQIRFGGSLMAGSSSTTRTVCPASPITKPPPGLNLHHPASRGGCRNWPGFPRPTRFQCAGRILPRIPCGFAH